jgi:polyisoprenoid-binding protein YceI
MLTDTKHCALRLPLCFTECSSYGLAAIALKHRIMKIALFPTLTAIVMAGALLSCNETSTSDATTEAKPEETGDIKVVATLSFADGEYNVDGAASTCTWVGKEASGSSHTGDIQFHKGSLSILDNTFSTAFIGIDMNSINCTDLEGEAKGNLEGHLKSDDFFGTDKHQYAMLAVEAIKTKEGSSMAVGKLTIKDITQPVGFPITMTKDGDDIVVDGTLTFDRSDFDVRFRSDKWYSDLGDKLIYNDITLSVHVVARPE